MRAQRGCEVTPGKGLTKSGLIAPEVRFGQRPEKATFNAKNTTDPVAPGENKRTHL